MNTVFPKCLQGVLFYFIREFILLVARCGRGGDTSRVLLSWSGKRGNCWSEGTGAITRSLEAGRWTAAISGGSSTTHVDPDRLCYLI